MTRQTSVETYHQIIEEDLLSPLRAKVYSYLHAHGPCTANELVKAMALQGQKTKSRDYFAQRLSELRECGVVAEVGKRSCAVTGRTAIIWQTTNRLPINFEKQKKTKCKTCNGKGYHVLPQQARML